MEKKEKVFKPPYGVILHRRLIKVYKRKMKELKDYIENEISKDIMIKELFVCDIFSALTLKMEKENSLISNTFEKNEDDEKILAIEYKLFNEYETLSFEEKFNLASKIFLVHKSFKIRLELYTEKLNTCKNKSMTRYIIKNTKNIIYKSKIYDKQMDDLYFEPILTKI